MWCRRARPSLDWPGAFRELALERSSFAYLCQGWGGGTGPDIMLLLSSCNVVVEFPLYYVVPTLYSDILMYRH